MRNLTVQRCRFEGTENGIRIKSPRGRGGTIENASYSDITMINVDGAITITCYYPKIPKEDTAQPMTAETPIFRNLRLKNITATSRRSAGVIVGLPESPVSGVVPRERANFRGDHGLDGAECQRRPVRECPGHRQRRAALCGRGGAGGRSKVAFAMKRTGRTLVILSLTAMAALCLGGGGQSAIGRALALSEPAEVTAQSRVAVLQDARGVLGAQRLNAPEWAEVPAILARIKAPVFPDREFPITQFGAAADGRSDCTEAIGEAIAACAQAGGGRVVVPAGEFLSGPIHLLSHVELHLEGGATLKFTTDPTAYLPPVLTRFEGMECYNLSPLIYAFGAEGVAVTGEGVLDGQAGDDHWWPWKGKQQTQPGAPNQKAARDRLVKMVDQNVPVEQRRFGVEDCLRPSFVEFYRCRNVLIEGVRIRRSPMWELHPTLSTNVIVRGVHILSHGPNNDGCDPECCQEVLIENCVFDTGDDCIAIKSGRNNDGRRVGVPSANLIIRGCTMKDGHGGVVIGSEMSGGCRNVFAEDCRMDSPNLERVLRLKSNAARGGVIENVFMRNLEIGQVADAVLQIDFLYEEGTNGPYKPVARNVVMEQVAVRHTPRVLNVAGFPGAEISGVRLYDCTFNEVQKPDVVREADVKLVGCRVTRQN